MASKTANPAPAPTSIWSDIGGLFSSGANALSGYYTAKATDSNAKIAAANTQAVIDNNAADLARRAMDLENQKTSAPTALSFDNLKITPTFLVIAAGGIFVLFNALKK